MWFKNNFYASIIETKKLSVIKFLDEMNKIIEWDRFAKIVQPYYEEKETGRPKMDLVIMLKIQCLQQWFDLSDPKTEQEIYDRSSFQKFLDIDLANQPVPDETTICKFRHLMEKHSINEKFFKHVLARLQRLWLTMKQWTSVDATIIKAPSSTKNKEKKRDPEMTSTKKWANYQFGMKAHVGADSKTGIVHSIEYSTASEHDSVEIDSLLHWEEEFVTWDKAYDKHERKRQYREKWIFYGIINKAARWKKLTQKQEEHNRIMSKIRAKVEHVFLVVKHLRWHRKTRYRWLYKNGCQFNLLFALTNLYRMRYKLLES